MIVLGEVESLILKIDKFLQTYSGNLILNADDPNVARLGKSNPENSNIYYFSVEPYKFATKDIKEAGEGKFCPFCQTRLLYDYYQYSHIGKFSCPSCGFGNNDIYKKAYNVNINQKTFTIDDIEFKTQISSIYTIYNFTASIACACLYKIRYETIQKALSTFSLHNGRLETLKIKDTPTILNLAKNPTGCNVSLRILNEDTSEKELLFVLNDNIADGFDVSWIWDINFDNLNNVKRIITSGKRAYDIAIRIKVAGFDESLIECYNSIEEAINHLYSTNTKKYVIANYTALQPCRNALLKYNSLK